MSTGKDETAAHFSRQAEAYAARKGMPLKEVERWLAPNLGYEP